MKKHWYNDLLTAWLIAVTAEYLLLPPQLRGLAGVEGLAQMSPVRVLALTTVLCLIPFPRWSMPCAFGVLAVVCLFSTFTWPLLLACVLVGVLMGVYARFGHKEEPLAASPSKEPGNPKTVAWMAILFFVFLSVWGVSRVLSFRTPTYDFGLFSQMFYYMKETGLPLTTLERDGLLSHFAVHVSPIYYLMLPVYWLIPTPAILQILQAAVTASAVIPLWKLAKLHGFESKQRSLLCALLMLLPVYGGGCYFDLHENCFLTPLILWFFYGIDRRNRVITAIAAFLTLMVKEDAAVYAAVIGLWLLVNRRKTGGILLVVSMCWFLASTGYLASFGDGVMSYRYENFLYAGSSSLLHVVIAVLTHPMKAVYECVDPEKLHYIAMTLLPLLGLPLLTRRYDRYLLLIPYILINLMSDYEYQHSIWFQYSFGSSAFLIYQTVVNLAELRVRTKPLIVCVLIAAVCFGSEILPVATQYPKQAVLQWESHQSIREALDEIPDDASVTASTFYTTYLSQRDVIYDLGYASRRHILDSEYVVIDPGHDADWETLTAILERNGYIRSESEDIPILIYRKSLANY